MTADQIKAAYATTLKETVVLRRYTGIGGSRTSSDYPARGKATFFGARELTTTILQGDQRVLAYVDDLIALGWTLPVLEGDRAVVDGKEHSIIVPGHRKAPDGTVIALELQVRG